MTYRTLSAHNLDRPQSESPLAPGVREALESICASIGKIEPDKSKDDVLLYLLYDIDKIARRALAPLAVRVDQAESGHSGGTDNPESECPPGYHEYTPIEALRDLIKSEAAFRSATKIYGADSSHRAYLRADREFFHAKDLAKMVINRGRSLFVTGPEPGGLLAEVLEVITDAQLTGTANDGTRSLNASVLSETLLPVQPPREVSDLWRRPIWLRKETAEHAVVEHAVVLIEQNGEWREIIRERLDGEFSHIWEDRS